jgi:uncharacterized membrane protein SpoIIM required for sporulation
MKLDRFLRSGEPEWKELASLSSRAKGRAERLGPDGVRRLSRLYRRAVADLALARRAFPHDPVIDRLENLVASARPLVYAAGDRRRSAWNFLSRDYWQLVRERPAALAISAAALLVPLALGGWWGYTDPAAAAGIVPNEFRVVMEPQEPGSADRRLSVEQRLSFAGLIFTNNVRVSFLSFVTGMTAGVGTVLVLLYNGSFIGALTGIAVGAGGGSTFLELVLPHGVLELSCIIVAGSAGLRLGWALIDPGHRKRRDALADEAQPAVLIALGTAPWLVLAGMVEGILTPTGLGLGGASLLGLSLGIVYWSLVFTRGKVTAEPQTSP